MKSYCWLHGGLKWHKQNKCNIHYHSCLSFQIIDHKWQKNSIKVIMIKKAHSSKLSCHSGMQHNNKSFVQRRVTPLHEHKINKTDFSKTGCGNKEHIELFEDRS